MILEKKNHFNQITTTIDFGTLKFNNFLSCIFYEIQSNGKYNLT